MRWLQSVLDWWWLWAHGYCPKHLEKLEYSRPHSVGLHCIECYGEKQRKRNRKLRRLANKKYTRYNAIKERRNNTKGERDTGLVDPI